MKLNIGILGDRFGILFDGRSIDHGHGDTNDAVSGRLNILSNGFVAGYRELYNAKIL